MADLSFVCEVRSEVGLVRPGNEDAVFASPRLAAVADGVGGAAAGEVASRLAINEVVHLDKCRLRASLPDALGETVRRGDETIGFVADCRPAYTGMATTLTCVAIEAGRYVVANAGDSRAYLLRGGRLRPLTSDDSFGVYVTNVLDGRGEVRPAVRSERAREGDRVLVCSDGLTDLVEEAVIEAVLGGVDAARRLVELALAAGGRDNVSVVVADVVRGAPDW